MSGLSSREAMVVNLGVERATHYGWREPGPAAAALTPRRQRAERLTDELQAPLYATLTARQRAEFARLVDALTSAEPSPNASAAASVAKAMITSSKPRWERVGPEGENAR